MPTINIDLVELRRLSGISDLNKIEYAITQLKGEIKGCENDEIIVELEPDRPDLLSVEGLARALRGFLEIEVGIVEKYIKTPRKSGLKVLVENAHTRPYIACAIVRNLKLDSRAVKNLMRMQEALHLTLGRNRRKVAIGFHDLRAIEPPIIYTEVDSSRRMIPLDMSLEMSLREILRKHPKGLEYGHLVKDKCPVYIDRKGIFSFPPVINSERTRVTEKTRELFIELTGTDERAVIQTLNILVANLIDRNGEIESVKIYYKNRDIIRETPELKAKSIKISLKRVLNLIGLSLSAEEVKKLLRKMQYEIKESSSNYLEVIIPPYRVDILHEVDIAEDIAIAYGYDRLTPELPNIVTIGRPAPSEILEAKIRQSLIGMGFQEVLTFTLSSRKLQIELMNLEEKVKLVEIENPISAEMNVYRRWITPHLMKFLSLNKHVKYPQRIFEIGYVAVPISNNKIVTLRNTAAAIASTKISFSDLQGVLEGLMKDLDLNITLKRFEHPSYIPGRTAAIYLNERMIGIIGEIHPQVLNNFEVEVPVIAFEITHYKPTYPNSTSKAESIYDGVTALWI